MMTRMRIGAFSKHTGLSRDTIRFYERRGLLRPTVEDNGYRTFGTDSAERAIAIQMAQALGFTLAEIEQTIALWEKTGLTADKQLQFLSHKRAELVDRIGNLQRMVDYLDEKMVWLRNGNKGVPPSMRAPMKTRRRAREGQSTNRPSK
jgi:MerR family transcriptional regulator, copper efflux regulator